jgi:hypothetical protein
MHTIRWVLLLFYVLTIVILTAMGLSIGPLRACTLIGLAVLIVSQAVLLKAVGTSDLCRPVRPLRLIIPVAIAAFMMAVLVVALTLAISELVRAEFPTSILVFWLILGASWVFWFVVFFFYTRRTERYRVIKRLTAMVLTGSLLELLATVPSHLIVIQRPVDLFDLLVGIWTGFGVTSGLYVMLWAFGLGIFLLFLRAKRQAESARLTHQEGPTNARTE